MEYIERFEVLKYLNSLRIYFEGDLEMFEKVAFEIEAVERPLLNEFNTGSMFDPKVFSEYNQRIKAEGNERFFRLTVPLALSLFSVVDLVGFLISKVNLHKQTEENFKSFFRKSVIQVSDEEVIMINRIFRQGLAHTYFPKLGLGVKYHSTNPENKLFFKSNNDSIFLNVNKLKDIVLSTFKMIVDDVSLYQIMEEKYQQLIALYRKQVGDDIETLVI